jgi:hypothetical protein
MKTKPHPYKPGQTRNVYEFPVTRKIIIEADSCMTPEQVEEIARRGHDKELGLEIFACSSEGNWTMTLSEP